MIDALNDLEKRNPKILNIPLEKEEIIVDNEECPCEEDNAVYEKDIMPINCLLRCKQESSEVRKLLKDHCKNSKYVKTSAQYELCFYEAILISLHNFISELDNF